MHNRPEGSCRPFETLVECLKADEHEEMAKELSCMLFEVAWTSSSEMLGELGKKVLEIKKQTSNRSMPLESSLNHCIRIVREVWPDIK